MMSPQSCTIRRVIAAALCAVFLTSPVRAQAGGTKCLRSLQLRADQQVTLATVVVNEISTYTRRRIDLYGSVTTADGRNALARVWLHHSDFIRWGSNSSLPSTGPLLDISKSVGFFGKGGAEIRGRTLSSPTTLCLCTVADMDDKDARYLARRKECSDAIDLHPRNGTRW